MPPSPDSVQSLRTHRADPTVPEPCDVPPDEAPARRRSPCRQRARPELPWDANRKPPSGHAERCRRRCRRRRAFLAMRRGPLGPPADGRCHAAAGDRVVAGQQVAFARCSGTGIAGGAPRRAAARGSPDGNPLADIERTDPSAGTGCGLRRPRRQWSSRRFSRLREGPIPSRIGSAAAWPPGRRWDPMPPSSVCDAIARRAGADGRARPLLRLDPGDPERTSAGSSLRVAFDRRLGLAATVDRTPPRGKERRSAAESWLPPEAIVGPSGAREVSDFSTGTVETASNRPGEELPAAGGRLGRQCRHPG